MLSMYVTITLLNRYFYSVSMHVFYSTLYVFDFSILRLQNQGIENVEVSNVISNQAYGLAGRRQGTGEETEPVIYEETDLLL